MIFGKDAAKVFETVDFNAAIQQEIKTTAFNGSCSGLLQIMGLATVIRGEIHLIYSDTKHVMLSLLNGIYLPRESTGNEVHPFITIMWTNYSGWPDRSKSLNVNHFVPVLKVSTLCSSDKNAEPSNCFFVFKKRRHEMAKKVIVLKVNLFQITHKQNRTRKRVRSTELHQDLNLRPQMPFSARDGSKTRKINLKNKSSNLYNISLSPNHITKNYLDKLSSIYYRDLFNLNTNPNSDIKPDHNIMSNRMQSRYYSPNSYQKIDKAPNS